MVGHRDNEAACAGVGSTNVRGAQRKRQRGVPEGKQVAPHEGHPGAPSAEDVFDEDVARPFLFDDAAELIPKTAPLSLEPATAGGVRDADILAREPADDNIDVGEFRTFQRAYVFVARDTGPILFEDSSSEPYDLALPAANEPSEIETVIETADAGEE